MRVPARTIWDTKIQCLCSIITARDGQRVEMWMCGNFAHAGLNPPTVVINPNVLYPIEQSIRKDGRFAINIFSSRDRDALLRIIRVRRRTPFKERVLGMRVDSNENGTPYLPDCQRVLFCELIQQLDTGDHTVMIARVLSTYENPAQKGLRPILYPEVSGFPSRFPRMQKIARVLVTRSGMADFLRRLLHRRRLQQPVDLVSTTYETGGQTEREIRQILAFGALDEGRVLSPPEPPPAILSKRIAVCVVGTGQWGSFHCQLFRQASPKVDLYVCGRDQQRLAHLARAVGAKDCIIGLERAVEDNRLQAFSLALPHHIHASAAQLALGHGKHVLVEKPIANTLQEARSMIDSARRSGLVFMVAEDVHFRPAVREAALAIDRGDIGEPLYFKAHAGGVLRPRGWKADANLMGGGVLMDLGVHYVRALRMIMGEPDGVLATRGMQIDTKMAGEDSAQVLFRSSYGWQGHLLLNWAGPRGHSPDIIVSGDQGVIHLWPAQSYYDWFPAEPRPIMQLLSYVRPSWLAEKLMRPQFQQVRRSIPGDDTQGYISEVREFLAAIAENRPPQSDPVHAMRDLEIVLNGYAAMQQGEWVCIAPFTPLEKGADRTAPNGNRPA